MRLARSVLGSEAKAEEACLAARLAKIVSMSWPINAFMSALGSAILALTKSEMKAAQLPAAGCGRMMVRDGGEKCGKGKKGRKEERKEGRKEEG